jgi:phospholipase C
VSALFGLPSLTARDAAANNLVGLLKESTPRMDAPTNLSAPAERPRRAMLTEEAALAQDAEPLRDEGNLPGFLQVALKTRLEIAGPNDAAREAHIAEFRSLRTRGDARRFLARTTSLVREAHRTAISAVRGM